MILHSAARNCIASISNAFSFIYNYIMFALRCMWLLYCTHMWSLNRSPNGIPCLGIGQGRTSAEYLGRELNAT